AALTGLHEQQLLIHRARLSPGHAPIVNVSPMSPGNCYRCARVIQPEWGGRRKRAGRKAKGPRAFVSHKARPRFEKPAAVLVTLRVASQVWNLRSRRCFRVIEEAFANARERFGFRVIEFSVLGNHLHLLVEADSDASLA